MILKYNPDLFDISEFGSLGDFVAGFTAPIINIVAAILVYKSFQAQVKANEMQFNALKDDKDFDRIQLLLKDLKDAKDNFSITTKINSTQVVSTVKGNDAIDKYLEITINRFTFYKDDNPKEIIITTENTHNLFTEYLEISNLVAEYLIKYYKEKDISFNILLTKFLRNIKYFHKESSFMKHYDIRKIENKITNMLSILSEGNDNDNKNHEIAFYLQCKHLYYLIYPTSIMIDKLVKLD